MSSFTDQIDKFATRTVERLHKTTGAVVAELGLRLDIRSPVGDPRLWKNPPPKDYRPGRFRGNWQLGVDAVPTRETGLIDPSGEAAYAALKAAIPQAAGGHVYHLANLVPYGPRLEDGWSTQAPAGLVGLTALEFPQIVAAAAEGARL